MSEDQAPDATAMATLLADRHQIEPGAVAVEVDRSERCLVARVDRAGERFTLRVTYRRGAEGNAWTCTIDALDNLLGMLVEADYAHRSLPAGTDVAFGSAFFSVSVERSVPALEEMADQLLKSTPQ